MEIRLDLGQDRFVTKESMVMRIVIRNTGTTPLDVPNPENNRNVQPVYTVTGPSYPKGHTFHFRSAALGDPRPPAQAETGMTVRLAPGATHEAALPLEQLLRFPQPGPHTIEASLNVAGVSANSGPVKFLIEAAVIRSMRLLADDGAQASSPIRVLCLVESTPQPRLYQAILREERPDLGEVFLAKLVPVAEVPAGTAGIVGPWANHNRLDSFLDRFGWYSGAELGVEGLAGSPGLRFQLPAAPKSLVRPALLPDSGEVDAMAISGDGRTVWLTRFPTARPGAQAKLVWSQTLPGAPAGARAALGTRQAANRRAAAFVIPEADGGSSMVLLDAGPEDAAPVVRTVRLAKAVPLPDSEPGIYVDADGAIRASALFAEDAQMQNAFVAEAAWPSRSGEGAVKREASVRLPSAPRAAAVTYSVAASSPRRREWIVQLQENAVLFSGSPKRSRKVQGRPAMPLELLGMSRMTYLLVFDQQGLPRLELMH